jgi:carbon monoxide dehydrogenase subunit G
MMAGQSIVAEQQTTASVEQVWSVLTDIHSAAEVLSGVTSVDVLSDGPYAVGTTWRETRTMMGRAETQEMCVTVVDPPHRTVITAQAGGVTYTTEFTVHATEAGAAIRMEFTGEQPDASLRSRLMWAVLGRVGSVITKRILTADLRDIAAAAERA